MIILGVARDSRDVWKIDFLLSMQPFQQYPYIALSVYGDAVGKDGTCQYVFDFFEQLLGNDEVVLIRKIEHYRSPWTNGIE